MDERDIKDWTFMNGINFGLEMAVELVELSDTKEMSIQQIKDVLKRNGVDINE